jgi:flagellin
VLQIADGAVGTITNILDRMKELAAQAASDNVSNSQRTTLQSEFTQLRDEITRIVDTTTYQGAKLLDGNFGAQVDTTNSGFLGLNNVTNVSISGTDAGTYNLSTAGGVLTVENNLGTANAGYLQQNVTIAAGAQTVNVSLFGISFDTTDAFVTADIGAGDDIVVLAGTGGNFLVGASGQTGYDDDIVSVTTLDATVGTLTIDTSTVATRTDAQAALVSLDSAINQISAAIGDLGAAQSRIEFATQNVTSIIENYAAAESVIRDADMAYEMTTFTKNQILQQAGTAMLAQANAAPQSILSLLAG